MALPSLGPIVIYITSVVFVISLVAFLASCLCKSSKEKNSNFGVEGKLKYTAAHSDVSKHESVPEDDTELKNKSTTINRQLPDIPKNSSQDTVNNSQCNSETRLSLLYEVVTDSSKNVRKSDPGLPNSRPNHATTSVQNLRDSEPSSSSSLIGHPYAIVEIQSEHAYDKIQRQAAETSGDSTDNYSVPHIYAVSTNASKPGLSKTRNSSWDDSKPNELPPPVPEKLFDDASDSSDDTNGASDDVEGHPEPAPIILENAQVMNVQFAVDPIIVDNEDTPSEGPYTSISVREPIANLRAAEQLRVQERMTHVYTVVQEYEQDQTYAEIESTNQAKGLSSRSKEESNPKVNAQPKNDVPPDPPTVESLMSVTQAHSRQASDASSASHSVLSSPEAIREKPFKFQIEKNEGLFSSLEHSSHKPSATLPAAINVEELYAKVNKNKSPSFPKFRKKSSSSKVKDNLAGSETRRVFSMDYSNAIDKSSSLAASFRNSTAYDMYREEPGSSHEINTLPPPSMLFQDPVNPDYESLKKLDFEEGYETLQYAEDTDADPEYETLQSNLANQSDPGYEKVKKPDDYIEGPTNNFDSDPPYEGVKDQSIIFIEDNEPPYEGIKQDTYDPPYEGIESKNEEPPYEGVENEAEPFYEGIGNHDTFNTHVSHCAENHNQFSDNEPPYQGINSSFTLDKVQDIDYAYESDPMYEGIQGNQDNDCDSENDPMYEGICKIDNPNNFSHDSEACDFPRLSGKSAYPLPLSSHSDSSEGEYEKIKSDSLEPGYERVRNNSYSDFEEPAYETLKPRKKPIAEKESGQSSEQVYNSELSVDSHQCSD